MAPKSAKVSAAPSDGLFHLGTRDPGAWGIASWHITTPEGAQKTVTWDGQPGPLLVIVKTADGSESFRAIQGDALRVQVADIRAAQRAVELFVTTLNDGILSERAAERTAEPGGDAGQGRQLPSAQPGLWM